MQGSDYLLISLIIFRKKLMKWPSKRLATSLKKSFGMYEQAMVLEAKGIELIHLGFGKPYADTPVHIKEASKKALDGGIVHYGDFRGAEHLRKSLADKLQTIKFLSTARMKQGKDFNLRDSHDYLWLNGNVPIALLEREYLAD